MLNAVIPDLLQVLHLPDVPTPDTITRHSMTATRWPSAARASMQAALERARELGITRTDREAPGPLLEGFSRYCPQPG